MRSKLRPKGDGGCGALTNKTKTMTMNKGASPLTNYYQRRQCSASKRVMRMINCGWWLAACMYNKYKMDKLGQLFFGCGVTVAPIRWALPSER